MLSWRLWQLVSEPDINNPIFKRVSQIHKPAKQSRHIRIPRLLVAGGLLALMIILIQAPQLLLLVFEIPILMITLIVLSPALLPFAILLAGAYLVSEVIGGIYREKHQYTYDLICASTQGSFNASWSFAIGILHRGDWFAALKWGTRLTLRLGQGILIALTLLTVWLAASDGYPVGFEQLRLLLMLALGLTLYYTQMTQTLVISLVVGLYASSLDWVKRDATWIGMVLYVLAQGLPFLLALLVYIGFNRVDLEPHPLVAIAIEAISLAVIVFTREVILILLWHPLNRQLNASAGRGDEEIHHLAARPSAWSVM